MNMLGLKVAARGALWRAAPALLSALIAAVLAAPDRAVAQTASNATPAAAVADPAAAPTPPVPPAATAPAQPAPASPAAGGAKPKDGASKDASSKDASPKDAPPKDAPAKDGSSKDASSKDGASAETGAPSGARAGARARYDDWEMRCETPPGAAKEQCAILQSVAAEDRPNVSLVVIVLKVADGKSRLLRIVAPLGVLVPKGLGLKIDDADIGRAGFVRCLPSGCVAEVIMEDKLIEQMRGGKTATFIIYQTPEEGIGIPLAMKGFAQAFDALP